MNSQSLLHVCIPVTCQTLMQFIVIHYIWYFGALLAREEFFSFISKQSNFREWFSNRLQGCRYNGKTYKIGLEFRARDGCNRCRCGRNGRVNCTRGRCLRGTLNEEKLLPFENEETKKIVRFLKHTPYFWFLILQFLDMWAHLLQKTA